MENKSQMIHIMCLMFQSGRTELTHRETKYAWKRNKYLKNKIEEIDKHNINGHTNILTQIWECFKFKWVNIVPHTNCESLNQIAYFKLGKHSNWPENYVKTTMKILNKTTHKGYVNVCHSS